MNKNWRSLCHKVFGHFTYRPPEWTNELYRAFMRRPRKYSGIIGGALAVALVAAFGIHRYMAYLDSLPKPDYVTVHVLEPGEPDLETGQSDELVLSFSRSAARIDQLDKPVTEGVSLRPAIKGRWRWDTDQRLVFTPEKSAGGFAQWEIGTKYRVILERKLFPKHVLLEQLEYKFDTPELRGHFTKREFYQDPKDPGIKRAVFNIHYNYPLDTEDFKKRLSMEMQLKDDSVLGRGAKTYPFTVSFGKFQNEAYVVSDPIPIPKKDSVVHLTVDDGARTPRGGATEKELKGEVYVPGMFDLFRFDEARVSFARNTKFEPEQILILSSRAELPTEVLAKSLKLYLFPKRKKAQALNASFSHWGSPAEVTEEVRKEMSEVKFEVVPAEQENSKMHTFKIDVPVGRFVLVEVQAGIKSFGGYELQSKYEDIVSFPDYPKELMIMSQGAILSFGGDKKVPLLARNLRMAEFTLYRILPAQLNQFVFQNLRYEQEFAKPGFHQVTKDTLSEVFKKSVSVPFHSPAATQYFSLDLDEFLAKDGGAKKGIFFIEVRDSETGYGTRDQRLVLITDLGIVVKESNDKSQEVFVQNLRTGQPVADAVIEVLGANGLAVLEQRTNAEGRVSFPDLRDFKFEKRPIAFVAKKGGDMAYLPFKMRSRQLSYSRFDTGGIRENPESDQLTSYLFSDRGIYRPGDTVNLGMMVRARDWKKYFKNVPLLWSVTDPRGIEVKREKLEVQSDDLTALSFATQDSGATGLYQIRVFITKKNEGDELIGSLSVRVEEFLPDRMRISAVIQGGKPQGWSSPAELKGLVTLKNLFGTPAEKRRVVAEISLHPSNPRFKQFPDYQFAALKGDEKSYSEALSELETDEKGEALFDLDLARFQAGMFTLRFDAEGFEAAGGRAVGASSTALVSAWPYLLGVKSGGSLNFVPKGSRHEVGLVVVDPDLKKIAVGDLQAVLVERRYVSSLMQQPDGTYKYHSVLKEISGEAKPLSVPAAGAKFRLPTDTPGDFVAVFKNKAGTELNRVAFSVAGEANLSRSLERNAELQVTLNKSDFKPGEEIELQIKAPYVGAGLITIERDRVLGAKWFKTVTTSSIERIRIPAGVTGNAYVNVTFLRAIDSPEIFMSPLSYAVVPFSISLDDHKIALKIDAPPLVKPGEKLTVNYSASRKTKLILYGVDEGILQVAGYKLPDPLEYFFQRQALQVLTYQLLDLLLPEYSVLQKLSSSSGGDEAGARLSRNLNPFKRKTDKPVVFWSGVLEAGPAAKTFSYDVPDYFNGNIKVMAVASNGPAFGSAEQGVLSRGDFVITSNVPTFVVPGDEFTVGVGLSNQAEGTGPDAKVKLEINAEAFEVLGPPEQEIAVAEGHEGSAEFRLKAKPLLGSRPIRFRASAGSKAAKSSVETSVRPAVPFMTTLTGGRLPGASHTEDVKRRLLPEFRTQWASLSPLPATFMHGLKLFLDGYPYGCSEQLTSKVFPYVILKARPEFEIDSRKAAGMFDAALDVLRTRQTVDGGFTMYGAEGSGQPHVSLYVTHLLLEAKERGFAVPEDILNKALAFLATETLRDTGSMAGARMFAYSLYLQARAAKVPGDDLKFLHQALKTKFKAAWEQDLTAGWLAAAFKLVKQDEVAQGIFKKLKVGDGKVTPEYFYFYDGFVRDTAILFLGARHFPELMRDLANEKAMAAAFAPLQRGHYNTHSAAFSILALDGFLRAGSKAEFLNRLKIEEIAADGKSQALALPATVMPKVNFTETAAKLRYGAPAEFPFYYMQVQAGFDLELPTKEIKNKIEISREYLNGAMEPVTSAKMGDELQVRVRLRALVPEVQHVVIVDMLPSGLEPVLEPVAMASESDSVGSGSLPEEEGDEGEEPPLPVEEEEGAFNRFFRLLVPEAVAADIAKAASSAVARLIPQYVDRREDRIVIYGHATSQIQEFVYKAKAVAKGKFVVPPAFGESMYDREARYRGTASAFTVEAP